MHFSTIDRT